MIREYAEIMILGSGFAGNLLAMLLRKMGREPILIERGTHPRFAIGESSTPLANLSLERLCRTYDLPAILPLCKYGSWQQSHPELVCGLKRGFSFFKHRAQQEFAPQPDHANELLVAASPSDEVGDTHWYREHFDFFLLQEAQKLQIPYCDRVQIEAIEHKDGWLLHGKQPDQEIEFRARFLIDATGTASVLAKTLGIDCSPRELKTNTWSIYSHFHGVELWENLLKEMGGDVSDHPYRCDDAALHHIFDDGWMWVLRFNNGLASAGVVLDAERNQLGYSTKPEDVWKKVLASHPSVARQFADAQRIRPFTCTGQLQRCAKRVAGKDWAILPHAAYFIDPLLSAGNAHTLLCVERLAKMIQEHWHKNSLAQSLAVYETTLRREITFLDQLVHGCYCAFPHFELMVDFSMYYFAGAIWSETRHRKETATPADEFLFSHDSPFRSAVGRGYQTLLALCGRRQLPENCILDFKKTVAKDIAPYNVAGLCDPNKNNMYPFVMA